MSYNKPSNKCPSMQTYDFYSEKHDINILIQYGQKDEEKNKEETKKESLLESILEEIKKQLEKSTLSQNILSLEELIKKPIEIPPVSKNNIINAYETLRNYPSSSSLPVNSDPASGAAVYYVSPSQLPSGEGWRALGLYNPSTHTIYIANNLSSRDERFVYHHEVAHALGKYDEAEADAYATSKVGYSLAA